MGIFTSGLLKADFLEFNKTKIKNVLPFKLPGHISPYFVKFILHFEIQPRKRYDLKSENREIRRFLAVLENTGPKLKNVLPLNHEHYRFRSSCEV